MPEGLEWDVWRVVTSERINVDLVTLQTQWTMLDVLNANVALDVHEDLEAAVSHASA
ncbi:MAG: hypothetical protein KDB60_12695 [Propionibacteriaceae bacterium]|nr:hypothetical protein [Propionibacteriaceae bacterium]